MPGRRNSKLPPWIRILSALPDARLVPSNRDRVRQGESLGSRAMDLGVAISSGLEFFQNGTGRECRRVAVLAEVREEDMPQVGACDFRDEVGRSLVRKVAVAREDALLHGPRTLRIILKQCLVVVGLQKHRIDAARRVHHLARGMAEVGEDGEG